jgi:hypothetical protein
LHGLGKSRMGLGTPSVESQFQQALDAASSGGPAGHIDIGDYWIWTEWWGRSCLDYPEVEELHLDSNAERLGASVYRLVSKEAVRGLILQKVEWIRDTELTRQNRLFGISVFLFYKSEEFRRG